MPQGRPHEVTFVLGGARSGKSRFAQQLASGHQSVLFIATAVPSDPEMELRIQRHRQSRPCEWRTLEVPLDLDAAIASLQDEDVLVLVDCLTVYLANVMSRTHNSIPEIDKHIERFCAVLELARVPVVLVSNEVGSGVHALTHSGRLYCDLLGELNQRIASIAHNVILMVAGIALAIKGRVPEVKSKVGSQSAVLQTRRLKV